MAGQATLFEEFEIRLNYSITRASRRAPESARRLTIINQTLGIRPEGRLFDRSPPFRLGILNGSSCPIPAVRNTLRAWLSWVGKGTLSMPSRRGSALERSR